MGKPIAGGGLDAVEQAVDLLVSQPACARFVAHKLAVYFVSDDPPPALTERMAKTFQKTHGDIAEVLATLFKSREFAGSLGTKFKDPMHYVVATVRLAYDGKAIINTHPVVNWLNALGEPLFGRQTPDGYPLTESGWASSGQISRRFEIARTIGGGSGGLFEPEDGSPPATRAFRNFPAGCISQRSSRIYPRTPAPHWIMRARSSNGTRFYWLHRISTIVEYRSCNVVTSCTKWHWRLPRSR